MDNQLDKILDEMLDDFFANEQKKLNPGQINANKQRGKNWANVSGVLLLPIQNNAGEQLGSGGINLQIELLKRNDESDISEEQIVSLLNKINESLITSAEQDTYSKFRTGGFDFNKSINGRLPPGIYRLSLKDEKVAIPVEENEETIEFFLPKKIQFEIVPNNYKSYNTPIDIEVEVVLARVGEVAPEEEEEIAPEDDQPSETKKDIYNISLLDLKKLIKEKKADELKALYLSVFKRGDWRIALVNFSLLRIVFGVASPDENVGKSSDGFKKIKDRQEKIIKDDPEIAIKIADLEEYMDFDYTGENKLDEYGISLRGFGDTAISIRDYQYRYINLFDLIQDPTRNIEDYKELDKEISREQESEDGIEPLDPAENDPRVLLGEEHDGPASPRLRIKITDRNRDRVPDNDQGVIAYGANDPLNIRTEKSYDLKKFIKTYFQTTPMQFFKDIKEDTTRETVAIIDNEVVKGGIVRDKKLNGKQLKAGDKIVAGANFWPIHVAFAFEEFNQLNYKNNKSANKDYEAILLFNSTTNRLKNKELSGDNIPLVLSGIQTIPSNIVDVLEKRIAYYGLEGGSKKIINPITGKTSKSFASFKDKKIINPVNSVIDAVISYPGFKTSQQSRGYIYRALERIDKYIPIDGVDTKTINLKVKTFDGRQIYKYVLKNNKKIYFLSDNTRDKKIIEFITNKGIDLKDLETSPLYIRFPVNGGTYFVNLPPVQLGDKKAPMPSIFVVPAKTSEDDEPRNNFSKAEIILAKRLGLNLNKDFRFDINSGQSNFQNHNFYDIEGGEPVQKIIPSKSWSAYESAPEREPEEETPEEVEPEKAPPEEVEPEEQTPEESDVDLSLIPESHPCKLREDTTPNCKEIEEYVGQVAEKYSNLTPNIIFRFMHTESRYKQTAVSSVGALGLMQLMPDTAKGLGVDPKDWKQNIEGGAKMISRLIGRYFGVTKYPERLAAMAYFAGPGNVAGTIADAKRLKIDPIIYNQNRVNDPPLQSRYSDIIKTDDPAKNDEYHNRIYEYAEAVFGKIGSAEAKQVEKEKLPKPTGPISGKIPGKRDFDIYPPSFKEYENILKEDGYTSLDNFYKEIKKCFKLQSFLVLHDDDMDRVFGPSHEKAYKLLKKTTDENKCGQEIDNPGKLNLKRFEGYGKVQPISLKYDHNYGTNKTLKYLEGLQNFGDGEWRIGDLSRKWGGDKDFYPDDKMFFHISHKTGNDVDIAIPLKTGPVRHTLVTAEEIKKHNITSKKPSRLKKRGWDYIDATSDTIDLEKSVQLLGSLIAAKSTKVFLDKNLILALRNYIRDNQDSIADKRVVKKFSGEISNNKSRLGRMPQLVHEDGHADHFHVRFASSRSSKQAQTTEKSNLNEVLLFGHSQNNANSMGGALESALKSSGFSVTRKAYPGSSDNRLASRDLKKIPKKNYKKAFLFLNGNVYEENGNLMEASKSTIINYMTNTLKIPKENLTVILPPVNLDSDQSVIRQKLSERALAFFRGRGINTQDLIIANKDSFSDDVHAKKDAAEIKSAMQSLADGAANKFQKDLVKALIEWNKKRKVNPALFGETDHNKDLIEKIKDFQKQHNLGVDGKAGPATIKKAKEIAGGEDEADDQQEPTTLLENQPEHGYILTDLKEEKVYSKYNEKIGEKRRVFQGASMNKPIIALIHRMKYPRGTKEALAKGEIRGLLTYTAGGTQDSNYVNALISGGSSGIVHRAARGKTKEKLQKRLKSIGKLTVSDTKNYLKKLGLDENMKVRYTGNKHSPSQYHKFMKLIHNDSEISRLGIKEEVEEVLNYMKRTGMKVTADGRSDGGDRESARWPKYVKALNKAGVPVKKMYGKGGLVRSTFHYSLVIDDKYLLTIYTNRLNPSEKEKPFFKSYKDEDGKRVRSKDQHMSWFEGKLIEILKPVYNNKQETNEALRKIFDLINEAMR